LFMDTKSSVSINALITAGAFFCKIDGLNKEGYLKICNAGWELISTAEREAEADEKMALGVALGNRFKPPKEGGN